MKNIRLFTLLALLLMTGGIFVSCDTKPAEKQISDQFMAFSEESASFEPIKSPVKDKRIVILGEAGHADGRTFENVRALAIGHCKSIILFENQTSKYEKLDCIRTKHQNLVLLRHENTIPIKI